MDNTYISIAIGSAIAFAVNMLLTLIIKKYKSALITSNNSMIIKYNSAMLIRFLLKYASILAILGILLWADLPLSKLWVAAFSMLCALFMGFAVLDYIVYSLKKGVGTGFFEKFESE